MLPRIISALALTALLLLSSRSPASAAIDITGTWHFTIVAQTFNLTTECDAGFTQTGSDFHGTFDCDAASGTLDGTLSGSQGSDIDATLTLTPDAGGEIDASATGSVAADGKSMGGDWHSDVFGGVDGTFEGQRFGFPKGDVNCDSHVDGRDAIAEFSYLTGLDPRQESGCPPIGVASAAPFGDLDCDSHVTPADALAIVRYLGALPSGLPQNCPPLGQ